MFNREDKNPLLLLTLIIAASFLSISLFSYFSVRDAVQQELHNSSFPLLSENIYSEIKYQLSKPINISSAMANDTFLISWIEEGEKDPWEIERYLKRIHDENNLSTAFFVSDITKNYYYHLGILKKLSGEDPHDKWYSVFLSKNKEYDLGVDTNQADDNRLTVFLNHRIEGSGGKLLGIIGVGIEVTDIVSILHDKETRYGKTIYLTDNTGTIQVHKEKSSILSSKLEPDIFEKIQNTRHSQSNPDLKMEIEYNDFLLTSRYVPELDWYIVIEQNKNTLESSARKIFITDIIVGFVTTLLLFLLSWKIIDRFRTQLTNMANTDVLTGISNRREFNRKFSEISYRMVRYSVPASIILIDLDDFKEINDRNGHLTGDKVLMLISGTIRKVIRPDDTFARWGGDEFILMLEQDISQAELLAERLSEEIKERKIVEELNLEKEITMSIGVTNCNPEEPLNSVISRVDEAMYRSKTSGKNSITVLKTPDPANPRP